MNCSSSCWNSKVCLSNYSLWFAAAVSCFSCSEIVSLRPSFWFVRILLARSGIFPGWPVCSPLSSAGCCCYEPVFRFSGSRKGIVQSGSVKLLYWRPTAFGWGTLFSTSLWSSSTIYLLRKMDAPSFIVGARIRLSSSGVIRPLPLKTSGNLSQKSSSIFCIYDLKFGSGCFLSFDESIWR